jgi:hypothetical protein
VELGVESAKARRNSEREGWDNGQKRDGDRWIGGTR